MLIDFSCIWSLLNVALYLEHCFHYARSTRWQRRSIWWTPAPRCNLSTNPWAASVTASCSAVSAGIKAEASTQTLRGCGRKKAITAQDSRWTGPGWRGGRASLYNSPRTFRSDKHSSTVCVTWKAAPTRQRAQEEPSLSSICSSA